MQQLSRNIKVSNTGISLLKAIEDGLENALHFKKINERQQIPVKLYVSSYFENDLVKFTPVFFRRHADLTML